MKTRSSIHWTAAMLCGSVSGIASAQLSLPSQVELPVNWTWTYQANTLPDASGSIEFPTGTPYSTFTQQLNGFTSESVSGGVYQASTVNSNGGAYFTTPTWSPLVHLNSDRGYTVEWMAKVIQVDQVDAPSAASLAVDESRPGVDRFWNLSFMKNSSGVYRAQLNGDSSVASVSQTIQTNTFARYRVTVKNDTATLYINGPKVGTVTDLRSLGTNAMEFGDLTSTADSEYAVDFLRVFDGAALPPVENLYLQHSYIDPTNSNRRMRLAFSTPIEVESQAGYQGSKIWYQVSTNGGASYDTIRPLVQKGSAYSAIHPIAPVYAGINDFIASSFAPPTRVSNGEILVPFDFQPMNPAGTDVQNPMGTTTFNNSGVLIGKWNTAGTDIEWDLGGTLTLDSSISSRGLIEPAIVELNTPGRILMVMRGSNESNTSAASHNWKATSEDFGRTWSPVTEMTYADGTSFFAPSAMSDIRRHSNGKIYWFGNIIGSNANGNSPRYPLVIAEVDQTTLGLIASSVQTIANYTPGSPHFDTTQVQFSNFTVVEDPTTHNFLVSLYRFDPGKNPNVPGPYQTFTVVINPEPGCISFVLAGCSLLSAGRLRARSFI